MRNVQWNEGAPEKLEPGMVVKRANGKLEIIGHFMRAHEHPVHAWAWLIQPYQLEWLESMAKVHKAKSRGE